MIRSEFVSPALKSWSPFKNERTGNGGSLKWQDHKFVRVKTWVSLITIHCYRVDELGMFFSHC